MRVCCKRCNECEMLMEDESIVIIEKHGFNEKKVVDAVKCMKFGQYAFTLVELPESQLLDDMIWR